MLCVPINRHWKIRSAILPHRPERRRPCSKPDASAAQSELQQHIDAHADTLDKLATAVAIFGRDQKLTFYNRAFSRLWELSENWLDTHPADGEILDRLREGRRLPEQRDY